ncbi:DUF6000 family protein [Streptomyces iconiensis]|uniref:DUF6000 family protein n=1 Tax=Streptomyces iconiensis TaxID=1384038 RepID=A0ABT7A443_9ACTN|nr:DUF6000 family protein [Streptomyces iconiensis]MDJ1136090.1 DUF6000 family protein [Streptomyces iconiensis]
MMPPNHDVQVLAAARRYVMRGRPYMKLQGWNLRNVPDDVSRDFGISFHRISESATDADITLLLHGDWRAKITASWMAAMTSRYWFGELIGSLLVSGEEERAAKGYSFALTSFARPQDMALLQDYIQKSLDEGRSNSAFGWALAGWKHHHAERQGTLESVSIRSTEPSWISELGSPAELDLIAFLQVWVATYGGKVPRTDAAFSPVSFFREWVPVRGGEKWSLVEEESRRAALDQRLRESSAIPGEVRDADPLAVAADVDGRTVLHGLASGLQAGSWAVTDESLGRGTTRCETFSDVETAARRMTELSFS